MSTPGIDVDVATGQASEVYYYAMVAKGAVTGVLTGVLPTPPQGWVMSEPGVAPGWTFGVDGTFAAPPEPPEPVDTQAQMQEALNTITSLMSSTNPEVAALAKAVQQVLNNNPTGATP